MSACKITKFFQYGKAPARPSWGLACFPAAVARLTFLYIIRPAVWQGAAVGGAGGSGKSRRPGENTQRLEKNFPRLGKKTRRLGKNFRRLGIFFRGTLFGACRLQFFPGKGADVIFGEKLGCLLRLFRYWAGGVTGRYPSLPFFNGRGVVPFGNMGNFALIRFETA